jgi:hypothetical protein
VPQLLDDPGADQLDARARAERRGVRLLQHAGLREGVSQRGPGAPERPQRVAAEVVGVTVRRRRAGNQRPEQQVAAHQVIN